MPPDWKPSFRELKSDPLSKLEALIFACAPIVEAVRNVPDESEPVNGATTHHYYRVEMTSVAWIKLVKAYDEVKFKDPAAGSEGEG